MIDSSPSSTGITFSSTAAARGQGSARACVVGIVFIIAFGLRFTALDRYPLPIHQDELSNVYDGYSIAQTGADRDGVRHPFIVRGMGPGDYRPALYAHLAAVTTGLFGFSTWAGRLPAALLGSLTVVLIYLVARRMLGRNAALIALLFATFSPILIQYGRQAHEGACLPPFFSILSLYLLHKAIAGSDQRRMLWFALAGFAVGFSANAYGASRMTAALLAVAGGALILWHDLWCADGQHATHEHPDYQRTGNGRDRRRRAMTCLMVFAGASVLGAAPQLYVMATQPDAFLIRAQTLGHSVSAGPRWWAWRMIAGYGAHFDPRLLFLSFGQYGELTVARLSVIALPFVYLGLAVALWRSFRRNGWGLALLMLTMLICVLPAVVTKRNLTIMRASGVWSLYPLIASLGALTAGAWLRRGWQRITLSTVSPRGANLCAGLLCVAIAAFGVFNVVRYVTRPALSNVVYQNDLVRLGQWIGEHGQGYERIYVEPNGAFAHLYLAAFSGMSPREFQNAPRHGSVSAQGWEKFDTFGRFRFCDLAQAQREWTATRPRSTWVFLGASGERVELLADGSVTHGQREDFAEPPQHRASSRAVARLPLRRALY